MKNKFCLALILVFALSALAGCSSKKVEAPVDDFIDTLGVITAFSDATYDEGERHIQRRAYANLSTLLSDLESGSLDYAHLPTPMADYLVKKYGNLTKEELPDETQDFSIGIAPRSKDLLGEINAAIEEMKNDGTLKSLTQNYIDSQNGKDVEFEKFDGAGGITFAVTGDIPPIDYTSADGVFSGFTTAFLSEIGKKLKKNINLVSCDAGARPSMLLSRKADALFWVVSKSNEDLHPESFKMDGVLLTDSYLTCTTSKVTLNK